MAPSLRPARPHKRYKVALTLDRGGAWFLPSQTTNLTMLTDWRNKNQAARSEGGASTPPQRTTPTEFRFGRAAYDSGNNSVQDSSASDSGDEAPLQSLVRAAIVAISESKSRIIPRLSVPTRNRRFASLLLLSNEEEEEKEEGFLGVGGVLSHNGEPRLTLSGRLSPHID